VVISNDLERAREVLRTRFGYSSFRAGQERAVEGVLAGRDTLVVLPTGGGKSLCFQVPALMLPGLTVVVSPLISLMKDQVDTLTAKGLPAAFINSTLTGSEVADRLARARRGEIKLLYVAPERFDQGTSAERLREMGVSLLAIDEAHCISEWGHDFRPSYLRIASVRERLGNPPTVALTATATPEVRRDIARQLHLVDPLTVITGFDRTNLTYHVLPTKNDADKDDALVQALRANDGLAVVYASTRKSVERIAGVLERARVKAIAYHAGLDDDNRHEVQDAFMNEKVRVIVATNAFGLSMPMPNVRLVVHHSMPGTLEAYYQEAGRAGRDGLPSNCVLLHSFPDRFTHEFFIKSAYPEAALVRQVYDALKRRADSTGLVRSTADDIASLIPGKVSGRDVESAMRILQRENVLRTESDSFSRVFVRLIATPDRIKRELVAENDPGRELLRAMWRVVGSALNIGAAIDLDAIAPGYGGAAGLLRVLDDLQSRQFLVYERTGGGTRLVRPGVPFSDFKIDFSPIERRRKAELGKLDAMQSYAYTTSCRRAFTLRYFGDPAARPKCEGCDNCLGLHKGKPSRGPLSAPATRGAKGTRPAKGAARPSDIAPEPREADIVVGPEDAGLFNALKTLRTQLARAEKVPPYVVFPDRTLAEIAVRRPRTRVALSGIRGVGPLKLDKYGEKFLDVVRSAGETEAA
jgi:ATP-dependent DNA helicase RecQ